MGQTLSVLLVVCLLTSSAAAQVPTGTVSGRVRDQDKAVTPGVVVTATSPALQGNRSDVTTQSGDYLLPLLPPGRYTLTFQLSGFQTVTRTIDVGATQVVPLDVSLALGKVEEIVQVEASASPFLKTAQISTDISQDLMSTLPSTRTLTAAALMAPNVRATGPGGTSGGDGALVIAGAMGYDSLFLLNGVAITENVRGQPLSPFIEDAIESTTVSTGGISAEYGRFGGGVVNALTKSGGNRFSGSYRLSFANDDWRATTPFHETKLDDAIPTHEYTIGGPVYRDKLWFFTAGRLRKTQEARQTVVTVQDYTRTDDEKRYEFKLTYSPLNGQTVRGSFTKIDQKVTNNNFQNIMDLQSLFDQSQPQDLLSLNYNGVFGTSLTVEGQYSRRNLAIVYGGVGAMDPINGTLLIDRSRGNGTNTRYWAPTFCVCTVDERDNDEALVKGSYFLSTSRYGAHNIVFGYDHNNDRRMTDNHQSGSDFRILGSSTIVRDGIVYPQFLGNTLIQWDPITLASDGADLRTDSLFVDDTWRVASNLSLSLGLRWDHNDATDGTGKRISNASRFSPRLGVTWDPWSDGRWAINGSVARYVSSLNTVVDVSPAGRESTYQYSYQGPTINANVNGPLVGSAAAIEQALAWFNANGGTSRNPTSATVPGLNQLVGDSLQSPYAYEYAAGVSRSLWNRGTVRVDYQFRDYNDFFIQRTDLTTGRVTNPIGTVFDISLIENSNDLDRKYQSGTAQGTFLVGGGVTVGGSYTLSRTWGNFDGENAASGATTSLLFSYAEYREARWNAPDGDLGTDQRHRARIWSTYRVPLPEKAGGVEVGVLYTLASGVPLSASGGAGAGNGVGLIDPRPFVTNPGYARPLGNASTVEYFFFERDRFRTETQYRTDLSLNYSYDLPGGAEVFFHGEVLNVFNVYQLCGCGGTVFNNGGGVDVRTIDTAVQTASTSGTGLPALQAFNPFTGTPVEGVNWRFSPTFGQALSRFAYTTPRTFRFSIGLRF